VFVESFLRLRADMPSVPGVVAARHPRWTADLLQPRWILGGNALGRRLRQPDEVVTPAFRQAVGAAGQASFAYRVPSKTMRSASGCGTRAALPAGHR